MVIWQKVILINIHISDTFYAFITQRSERLEGKVININMSRYIPAIFIGGSAIFGLKVKCVNQRFSVKEA